MADAMDQVNPAAEEHATTDALGPEGNPIDADNDAEEHATTGAPGPRGVEDFEHLEDFERVAFIWNHSGVLPESLDGLLRTIVENYPPDFITAQMAPWPRAQAALRAYSEGPPPKEGSVTTTTKPETAPSPAPKPTESGLQPGRLYRYHAAANSVLASGIICAIIAVATRVVPGWVGFLTGFTPALIAAAVVCSLRDA
jgi:hypothetical protein